MRSVSNNGQINHQKKIFNQRRIQYFQSFYSCHSKLIKQAMQPDSFDKQMSMTNKKEKIFNVRKVPYKHFDHQKFLKPSYSPFHIKEHTEEPLSSKIYKKGGQYNYQVAIISSSIYKQLAKRLNTIKEQFSKQKQKRLEELRLKEEQISKCKAQKERIDTQRIKIIQRRDELRYKISEIRQRNEILKNQQMQRREEYRIMNMDYLRNMIIGMKYQNGMDVDIDSMTYEELLQLQEKIGSVNKGLTEDQIQKLPKRLHQLGMQEELCSVCYENPKEGEQMTELPCKHLFHSQCINQWLIKEKMCPMCKQQIITKIQSSKKLEAQEKARKQQNCLQKPIQSHSNAKQSFQQNNQQQKASEQLLSMSINP